MSKIALLTAITLTCFLLFNASATAADTQAAISITGLVSMIKDSEYVPLEEDLIVVEVTPEGSPIEKRLAKEADLFFYRQLKTKLLFGVGGVNGYENELVLSLRNVSEKTLENLSVIETLPDEITASAAAISSDENFLVLSETPAIIEFFADEMQQGQEKRFSYRLNETKKRVNPETLEKMGAPKALLKLEKNSCIGTTCKDLDPCTRDYCEKGECFFEPMPEGTACSEGKQCITGECIEAVQAKEEKPALNTELIGLAFFITAIAFAAIVLLAKKGKRF